MPSDECREQAVMPRSRLATRHPTLDTFMNILMKATVLVLNRNWQAINVRTPQEAFCMMATNVATGLEIEGEDHLRPVAWEEWITLPVRDQDEAVHTVRGQIRVPTVIVAVNYAKVPKKRPKLCAKAIRERDGTTAANILVARCARKKAAWTTSCPARAEARTPGRTWSGRPRT